MSGSDNYSIREYGRMIGDRARTQPFVEALKQAIRPDSVVLDIGTGTGIFALVACQLGAARVYAIEAGDAIDVARSCAANNAGADRVTWLQGLSTDIELSERADIVIADLHGSLPFHTNNIGSMIDARTRHLKPGGRMIPARDVLRVAPAHAPDEYVDVLSPWQANDYGIDFRAGLPFVCNTIWRAQSIAIDPLNFLAPPATWGTIDYSTVVSPSLQGRVEWQVQRAGTLHGLYVWFDTEVTQGIGFSNAPDLPSLPYGRTFFPLQQAIDVVPGDQLAVRLSATLVGKEYIFRWDTLIADCTGKSKASFSQTTFKDRPLRLAQLQRTRADYIPALNLEGQIDHAVMQAMSQSQTLGQIAVELAGRFPDRFADAAAALTHVAGLSMKYTE